MPLTPGTKLGPYEIQSPLGAGGMGEVYRARDTRLDRSVAIKILAAHLSTSPELKQRMEREARAISCLNHPHICQLYDIGEQGGADFLVMEFLEGETLAERLRKGAIPLNEIYKIGIALADALAVAHRQGIVHRDLKPGNIMLTQAGAKLMDFGLAKPLGLRNANSGSGAAPPSFTAAATLSGQSPLSPLSPLTTAGTIIGTIQYMSPEQIEGKEADARSDIFAFGAVLYEMTAGKRPFEGKSQLSLASSILEKDPDPITTLKPQTPPAFEHVITTCLQKNPEDRYLAAHDIKLELQWVALDKPTPAAPAPSLPQPQSSTLSAHMFRAVITICALILGAIGGAFLHREPLAQSIRTVINPPEKTILNLTGDSAGPPVLSPDGSLIAFTASGSDGKTIIWIRPVNSLDSHQITGTDNAIFPFWSPDSRSLGFFADGKLKIVDLDGDSTQVVADAPFGRGGAWGAGGVIVFSPNTQAALMRVNVSGGSVVPLTHLDLTQHTSHRWPMFLPDGKHFIYLAINHDPSRSASDAIYYASVDGGENRLLFHSQSNAVDASGYLLFARNDQLMAQSFNPSNGTLSGEPQIVAKGVVNDASTWHMDASASGSGLLIFASGGGGDWQLLWMDRKTGQLTTVADKLPDLQTARLSPQGDRIALQIDTGTSDIWVLDLVRGVRTRLTFGPIQNTYPIWSPDGKWIYYDSDRNGHSNLYRKPADGSGAEEILLTDDTIDVPSDVSPDGKTLIYDRGPVGTGDIYALPLVGEHKPQLIVSHAANSGTGKGVVSPDGRWLAYNSNESGTLQVYVVAFGGGQAKWQVSVNGGGAPQWSKDGKELYYLDMTYNLFAVPVKEVNGALQFGAAQNIVSNWSAPQVFYDVSPDGKKILLDRISQQVSQSVTVVSNFTAGLKK
jgi:eukaryotic-like serine/threonine-protein kinase